MSEPTRSHETRIELDASVEDVWKYLTDPASIARWFAPNMTVSPGVGGYVLADWGMGLAWKTAIEVWEPNKHLRLTETRERVMTSSPIEEPLPPCRLLEDFYLEAGGGTTVLRLVHSGFGTGPEWDGEYEGTRGGWTTCFLRMKHGLELHRNETVHNFIVTKLCPGVERNQVLQQLEAATPQPWELLFRADSHFCCRLPERNGSILTVSVQPSPTGSVAYVEVLLYGQSRDAATTQENEWRETVDRLFAR
jgi:uncharacterized protein YndB with AHSA1/START domain